MCNGCVCASFHNLCELRFFKLPLSSCSVFVITLQVHPSLVTVDFVRNSWPFLLCFWLCKINRC